MSSGIRNVEQAIYDQFIIEGVFPTADFFIEDMNSLFENIKTGSNISRAAFAISKNTVNTDLLGIDPKRPKEPLFRFGKGKFAYVSFLLEEKSDYYKSTVLSDVYLENERIKAGRVGRKTPKEWWNQLENRKKVWSSIENEIEKISSDVELIKLIKDKMYEKSRLEAPEANHFFPNMVVCVINFLFPRRDQNFKMMDFSAGWGDRLLGAIAAGVSYTGYDPNTNLQQAYKEIIEEFGDPQKHQVIARPFEDVETEENKYDLVFTSPPFFNFEHYSDEETQSDVKYKTPKEWLSDFYSVVITKSLISLKKGGYLCLYVRNTPSIPLADATISMIDKKDAIFCGVLGVAKEIVRESEHGKRISRPQKSVYKVYPIFVWKKE